MEKEIDLIGVWTYHGMHIWDYAFSGCYQLENIYYGGTMEEWDHISIEVEEEEWPFSASIKSDEWDFGTGNYVVHCTDGTVSK